ncbi:hypothetical protein B0T16DRAFT_402619 [Cercophora newfieldiana]|uniref:DUF7918 domain-containing protein n=1 Tax=Cercophora newfieldiana TaxID=92897 RepID=A0AA40D026_9PEZI|nr:hypothetical protein B0T16DRAFT_402619 [Cercophora newfieldiana]
MAVLKHFPGLEVCIRVAEVAAKEHALPADADGAPPPGMKFHVVKEGQPIPYLISYIEAHPGKRFDLHIKRLPFFQHHGHHIAARVQIDGMLLGLAHDDTVEEDNKRTTWRNTVNSWLAYDSSKGGYQVCRFHFATLGVTEANGPVEGAGGTENLVDSLGLLRISFYHMKNGGGKVDAKIGPPAAPSVNTVSETDLKGTALDSHASWDMQPCKRQGGFKSHIDKYVDQKERPFAVFDFRYRSMDGLIKEGVVPPPTLDEQVQGLTDADARRLAREYLLMKVAGGPTPRGIKREREEPEVKPLSDSDFMTRYKARRCKSGRIQVDLTDD